MHLFDQQPYIVSLSSPLTCRRSSHTQFAIPAMWVNCFQTCFLQFFLLLSLKSKTAQLNSDFHDSAPAFDGDDCSTPWIFSGSSNSCYLLGSDSMTWEDGWDFCDDNGGYLLEVDSEQEHLDLFGRLNNLRIKNDTFGRHYC